MKYFLFSILLFFNLVALGQKPALDTSSFRTWAAVGEGSISNDGVYVSYHVYNQPVGSDKFEIQSINGGWKKEFIGASMEFFTNDSKLVIFKIGKDSLCLLGLGKEEGIYISQVSEFSLLKSEKGDWLAYRRITAGRDLILHNLTSGDERRFASVTHYLLTDNGKTLVIERQVKKDNGLELDMECIDIASGEMSNIWSSSGNKGELGRFAVSTEGNQLAFIVENKGGDRAVNELWYYRREMGKAVKLVDNHASGIEAGMELANQPPEFSKNGRKIFFGLQTVELRKPKPGSVRVDVWSYTDKVIQPIQMSEAKQDIVYSAVIDVLEKMVIRLERSEERIVARSDDYVLVGYDIQDYNVFESYWNIAVQSSYWLVSIKDGSRKLLKDHIVNPDEGVGLSPGGNWALYYDYEQKNYFSYEIATGITRNITKGIPVSWLDRDNDRPDFKLTWVPWRKTWLHQDEAVLIYDNHDIWLADPKGSKPVLGLTNGYGRIHHIKFELAEEGPKIQDFSSENKSLLVLTAVDKGNKNRGFYTKILGQPGDPELGIMGAYVFGDWEGNNEYNYPPTRAKNSNTYLVERMSAVDAPNYFITHDFRHFVALTNVRPQAAYNWMTTELLHWKDFYGRSSTGVLYKPENFDPNKKYPIIFDFYEIRSDELNLFIPPQAARSRINIAWYVSNGYLVCVPDIHYKMAEPGQSAYNAIVSAAVYLAKMPWVAKDKMGIQGHSFGGYETNYIVTRTKLFAAACSASGISDLISWYGATLPGTNFKYSLERQQGRMGSTLWQMPDQYISNSPIFKADKVTTPLLMMSNKEDAQVPFGQGAEFFTALRRLGKRVWMLQYDGDSHSVRRGKNAADYSIRMAQFFDHYLKGSRAPKWMTRGISSSLKGIEDGLELDLEISTPGPGLNCNIKKSNNN